MKTRILLTLFILALFSSCSMFDDTVMKGSGTRKRPYVIESVAQLKSIGDDYNDYWYSLANDLDLSGENWIPIEFNGYLDGNGYVISNLAITSQDNYVGLFSKVDGVIFDLNIQNVNINAPKSDYVGAFSGYGGEFYNCRLLFGNNSKIVGCEYVGGISGRCKELNGCFVESQTASNVLLGESYIGGIAGEAYEVLTDCSAKLNIKGRTHVGGIAGYTRCQIQNCLFDGSLTGEDGIGGIVGYYGGEIVSCKVNATISASNGDASGIVGYSGYSSAYIYSSYAAGTISASGVCCGLSYYANANLSYSTMTPGQSSTYYGLAYNLYGKDCATTYSTASYNNGGSNMKAGCTNITTFLQQSYSDYASYWNFNDSWSVRTSSGTVSCPKLVIESDMSSDYPGDTQPDQSEDLGPWNGTIATTFAGGNGTYIDPYIIKTGGQLLLVKSYSDKYFELAADIDLNNKNWLPFEFKGNLDGKGHTISNLYVSRIDDNQGLFSKCSGYVSNLTISKASINAGSNKNVGAFSGSGGTFTDCTVILNGTSVLVGKENVGGISGVNASIKGCSVKSSASSAVIKGTNYVGGLIGSGNSVIDDCHVSCKISGSNYVGGIAGYSSKKIQNCSYEGTLSGVDAVGGIVGYYGAEIVSCKVNATISASNGGAAGIVGNSGYSSAYIYSCYTTGTISASGVCCGLSYYANANLSYSTMTPGQSSTYYGLAYNLYGKDCATTNSTASYYTGGTNMKAGCTNITTFLQQSYSDYASYWNFSRTWKWNSSVSCPKLSWEQ